MYLHNATNTIPLKILELSKC